MIPVPLIPFVLSDWLGYSVKDLSALDIAACHALRPHVLAFLRNFNASWDQPALDRLLARLLRRWYSFLTWCNLRGVLTRSLTFDLFKVTHRHFMPKCRLTCPSVEKIAFYDYEDKYIPEATTLERFLPFFPSLTEVDLSGTGFLTTFTGLTCVPCLKVLTCYPPTYAPLHEVILKHAWCLEKLVTGALDAVTLALLKDCQVLRELQFAGDQLSVANILDVLEGLKVVVIDLLRAVHLVGQMDVLIQGIVSACQTARHLEVLTASKEPALLEAFKIPTLKHLASRFFRFHPPLLAYDALEDGGLLLDHLLEQGGQLKLEELIGLTHPAPLDRLLLARLTRIPGGKLRSFVCNLLDVEKGQLAVLLANCPALQVLCLSNCKKSVDDSIIWQLPRACPHLKEIGFEDGAFLTDGPMVMTLRTLRGLTAINLHGCRLLGNETYFAIASKHPRALPKTIISHTSISPEAILQMIVDHKLDALKTSYVSEEAKLWVLRILRNNYVIGIPEDSISMQRQQRN